MTWSISIKRVGNGDTSNCPANDTDTIRSSSDQLPQQQPALTTPSTTDLFQHDDGAVLATATPANSKVSDQKYQETQHQPSSFTVQVNPDSPLSELHSSIEAVTGLKAHQQRLIYRGRILPGQTPDQQQPLHEQNASSSSTTNTNATMRICEVTGLKDGHTIHLFPRKININNDLLMPSAAETANNESSSVTPSSQNQDPAAATTASSLLSALFGMRSGFALSNNGNVTVISSSTNNSNNNIGAINGDGLPEALANLAGLSTLSRRLSQQRTTAAAREQRTAIARAALTARNAASSRAASAPLPTTRRQRGYRDGIPPIRDPGSLETIRQSLMTLHTMVGATTAQQPQSASSSTSGSIIRPYRTFFKGQWIDVKDTVNQWLEATIIEVATPEDLLGNDLHVLTEPSEVGNTSLQRPAPPTTTQGTVGGFPVVSTDDLEGRRSLLLRTIIVSDDTDAHEDTVEIPRNTSASMPQLLLVHYNGWPHRWDEWIRSDSPRIRAFRTRTRHSSSLPFAAPSIHSVHADTPPTHICSIDDEQLERTAILPEVARVLNHVQLFLNGITAASRNASSAIGTTHLQEVGSADEEEKEAIDDDDGYYSSAPSDILSRPHLPWQTSDSVICGTRPPTIGTNDDPSSRIVSQDDVRMLAALLDRLGRTLTDLAPHVASLATSFPPTTDEGTTAQGDAIVDSPCVTENAIQQEDAPPSMIDVEDLHRLTNNTSAPISSATAAASVASRSTGDTPQPADENADFVSGMVHTRLATSTTSSYTSGIAGGGGGGGRRHGPRDRAAAIAAFLAQTGLNDASDDGTTGEGEDTTTADASSFPESLARLLAGGGNDGGGIDIHIHAVLTPGFMPGGGLLYGGGGLSAGDLGTGTTSAPGSVFGPTETIAPTPQVLNEDDMGLFDELYGEPLDLPDLEDIPDSNLIRQDSLEFLSDQPPPLIQQGSSSSDDDTTASLEDAIDPIVESTDDNCFSAIEAAREAEDRRSELDALMASSDIEENSASASSPMLESPPVSNLLNEEPDVLNCPDSHTDQGNAANVDADSNSNDAAIRNVDADEETTSSENNEAGIERRDLLSVIRRYTLGRGSR